MGEFEIRLRSVKDVQDFVALATSRPFRIYVRDEHNKINGQSFMELFCLNFAHPLRLPNAQKQNWKPSSATLTVS